MREILQFSSQALRQDGCLFGFSFRASVFSCSLLGQSENIHGWGSRYNHQYKASIYSECGKQASLKEWIRQCILFSQRLRPNRVPGLHTNGYTNNHLGNHDFAIGILARHMAAAIGHFQARKQEISI